MRRIVEYLGADEFIRCYRAERVRMGVEGLACDVLRVRGKVSEMAGGLVADLGANRLSLGTEVEQQEELCVLNVTLSQGEISADDLGRVSGVARPYEAGFVRVTSCSNFLIPSVLRSQLGVARRALKGLDLSV